MVKYRFCTGSCTGREPVVISFFAQNLPSLSPLAQTFIDNLIGHGADGNSDEEELSERSPKFDAGREVPEAQEDNEGTQFPYLVSQLSPVQTTGSFTGFVPVVVHVHNQ